MSNRELNNSCGSKSGNYGCCSENKKRQLGYIYKTNETHKPDLSIIDDDDFNYEEYRLEKIGGIN